MTEAPAGCAWLRVMATSDVHAHLRGFDYVRNVEVEDWGLTRVATRISEARAEAPTHVLLDNGDILQGTPLAQLYSDPAQKGLHPVFAAMQAMGYDAIGLGNHEFNYGLDRLDDVLSETDIPVLCANVLRCKGADAGMDESLFPATTMLRRTVMDPETGAPVELQIGVLSVVPTQVMKWDGAHLKTRVEVRSMVDSASFHVRHLRQRGADIVILLAHTGIDPQGLGLDAENAAVALSRIPGIDAMITGHTHFLFPDPETVGDGIDADQGTICGVPTVMPGFRGGHLGVIDLFLQRSGGQWQVASHKSEITSVAGAAEDPDLMAVVEPAHQATLAYVAQSLTQTVRPIHSYLSQVRDDLSNRIVAMAQKDTIKALISGTPYADLPLLSASAPYQTGGRSGALAYVDIPAGPVSMRDANSLYPFPNTLCAVLATGAELQDWLERAASAFHQIRAGEGEQALLNPAFPGHAMDRLYGLSYSIDLSKPAHYDENGVRIAQEGAASRIVDLSHNGVPFRAEDQFVVAVSGYRAYGGGPYIAFPPNRILVQTEACALDYVCRYLQAKGVDDIADDPCWSFLPLAGATGVFETGPGVLNYEEELARLGIQAAGLTEDGFLRVSMRFDHTTCESAA